MKRESAYYSHSKKKYDEPIEEEEYAFIKEHFDGFVICPNQHLNGMIGTDNYYQVIATTSVVYASELNGFIGRGMYDECHFALENGIPVLVVRKDENGKFYTMRVIEVIKTGLPSLNDYARVSFE
jgi:hypothetical protein